MPNWKTKRRIMNQFVIKEISGVTRPAQGGALATFFKFDAIDDPVLAFAKVSFGEALDQRMIDQKFHRAFYDAFDGIYQRNEAFCEALKDGYASSEDTVRQYVDSVADLARAAAEATTGLSKSANPDAAIAKAVSDAIDQVLDQTKENVPMKITTKALLKAAVATFAKDGGTDEQITAIKAAASELGAEDELPATGALAVVKADPAIAQLTKTVAILSMDADVKKHFDALSASDQDAFLKMDAAAQKAEMAKGGGDDPVLYTTADGIDIRKSDGVGMLMMAKNFDKQAKTLSDIIAKSDASNFENIAKSEYGNLPFEGTVEMLKMADKMTDDDKKKKMLAALQASNKAAGKNFETIGQGNRSAIEKSETTAEAQLDQMAKEYASKNSVGFNKAYDAIIQTPEGMDLYSEFLAE